MGIKVQPRAKYQAIAQAILTDIHTGRIPKGGRLPSCQELASRYGVAYLTARRSMSVLVRKGVIHRVSRQGSFVHHTPHQALIGLLSEVSLMDETSHFYRALVKAIQVEFHGEAFIGHVYDGRDALAETADSFVRQVLESLGLQLPA